MEAELKIYKDVPDGDYNAKIEIEATKEGIEVDGRIFISWEWILKARTLLEARNDS